MLRAPTALKTFSFELCSLWNLDFTDVRDAEAPQKYHLESLGLDYHEAANTRRRRRGIIVYARMASFISFSALNVFKTNGLLLTTLRIERHSLINMFPPSLETLHLTHLELCPALKPVEFLLAQKSPQQIPSLKTLILEKNKYHGREPVNLVDQPPSINEAIIVGTLSRVAAAQDVSIEVRIA